MHLFGANGWIVFISSYVCVYVLCAIALVILSRDLFPFFVSRYYPCFCLYTIILSISPCSKCLPLCIVHDGDGFGFCSKSHQTHTHTPNDFISSPKNVYIVSESYSWTNITDSTMVLWETRDNAKYVHCARNIKMTISESVFKNYRGKPKRFPRTTFCGARKV